MIYSFLLSLWPESLITNLFRYTTFRAFLAAMISFILVVGLMPWLIRRLKALAVGQVIRDDGPQSHKKKTGTPTMGGLLMVAGIACSSLLLCRLDSIYVWISLFALLSFGAVGFWDDYLKLTKKNPKGVSFRAKMVSMGLLSLVLVAFMNSFGGVEAKIVFPFFKSLVLDLGPLIFLWGFLVINGAANAVNLTDGLDGLAIVPIMTTALVLLIMVYVTGHIRFAEYLHFQFIPGSQELTVVLASVLGVGLGFLWYNSHPAEVFMGDVGSLSLGGLLGTIALMTHKELVLVLAGFLFVMEAVSVMLQVGSYKSRKKRVFRMAPLHHHFELGGWPESKVIVRFWILSILFALIALSTLKIR
jgi:phospho-N-acetylmuramoyl-pentapeptide-transferase